MTIKFIDNELIIGSATIPENVTFRFSDILRLGGGGSSPSWQDIVLSGNGSLTLTNAKANGINYVKLFGDCEQDGTPTPTVPVDIVCNNGAIKVRHQSGLPLGYQPYEYITASGNQWLNTGVKLASTDIVETVFKNTSTTGYGALYGVFAMGDGSAFYANGTYYGYDEANGKVNTGISVDTEWHTLRQDFGNGVITLDGNDTTYTPFEFENTKDNYLFARYYGGSYGYGFKGSCKRYKVIRNGVVICDLIPAIQLSDNTIGMYDLVNDVFCGNIGSGSFTIANPINDLELYIDGTTETVQAHGKNLFDVNNPYKSGYAITQNGRETVISSFSIYSLKAEPLTTYTYSCNYTESVTTRIHSYDKNGKWIQQDTYGNANATKTFTTTSNAAEIRISINNTAALSTQLELGSTATTYEPYYNGDTATAEPLLGIGDYKDIQEIKTGAITRNVGVLVLTGAESWNLAGSGDALRVDIRTDIGLPPTQELTSPMTCTHYPFDAYFSTGGSTQPGTFNAWNGAEGYFLRFSIVGMNITTVAQWKDWLADQATAGTPLIVVYPISSPTTETVTGQTLHIQAGTNIVEITQASIDNLPLEVSYKGTIEQQGE